MEKTRALFGINSKKIFEVLLTLCIHFIFTIFLFLFLKNFGFIKNFPNNSNLLQWDVGWYKSIVENGYVFKENQQSNLAFYPLFPYLWKYLGVNYAQISVINVLFFVISIALLAIFFEIDRLELLLMLSFPSLFFCFVPYTEAIFFFSSTLLLIGLLKDKLWLAIIGIFIASMTRSASLIFFPAIIFAFFIELNKDKKANTRLIVKYSIIFLTSLLSTFLVFYLQYKQTGKFFAIFDVLKFWGKQLRVPDLPLTTWDAYRLLWLDGSAFFVGVVALAIIIGLTIKKFKNFALKLNASQTFAIAYLSVVSAYLLIYADIDGAGGSSIYSLNRYIFATPFFSVFVLYIFRNLKIEKNTTIIFFSLLMFTLIIFGLPKYIFEFKSNIAAESRIINLSILSFLSTLLFLMIKPENRQKLLISNYLINILLQIYIFNSWLSGMWIG